MAHIHLGDDHQVKVIIRYPYSWTPPILWENDKAIMDYFVDLGLPNKTLSILNRCRVYLQVITLSDIATANGLSILPCIKGGIRETTRTSKLLGRTKIALLRPNGICGLVTWENESVMADKQNHWGYG